MQIATAPDGTLTYLIDHPPAELPGVRQRDLQAAWDSAREGARQAGWSGGRVFRFRRRDGGWTELALVDADARCWAAAVDRRLGMQTGYGLSVCLRLLALVDLLARAPWAAGLVELRARRAWLHPALLRLAAEAPLTEDGHFDEHGFRARLVPPGEAVSCAGE